MKKLLLAGMGIIFLTGCVKKEVVIINKKDTFSAHEQKQNAKEEWRELDYTNDLNKTK